MDGDEQPPVLVPDPASQLRRVLYNTRQGGLLGYPWPPWRDRCQRPVTQNTPTDECGPLPMTGTSTLVSPTLRCYPAASVALHHHVLLFSPRGAISMEAEPPAASAHRDSSTNSLNTAASPSTYTVLQTSVMIQASWETHEVKTICL